MSVHNYDSIAFIYDRLAKLVYGRSLVDAQLYLLDAIPADAHILIVGGGTGWILEEIAKLYPSGLNIEYVDSSPKMIAIAEKRNVADNKVNFIVSPIQDVTAFKGGYDITLTPFLFDNFSNDTLQKIFPLMDAQLKPSGIWLYCDFQDPRTLWQKMLLRIMYGFFKVCCGIEASHLPDCATFFERYGYKIKGQRVYMKGFVVANIFERG